jgi:hypothetical protein
MKDKQIIGGVGVSGRKGKKSADDLLLQDNELAEYGISLLKLEMEISHALQNITRN